MKTKSVLAGRIVAANAALISAWNLERVGEFFTPDYRVHFGEKSSATGHAVIRKVLGSLKEAFPKIDVKVEILVESGTRIAWMRTLSGLQEGSYKGFPACGKVIVWRDMVASAFHDGKIAEEWVLTDLAERLLLSRKR